MNAFSDGSPVFEFMIFLLFFALFAAVTRHGIIAGKLDQRLAGFTDFTRRRRALPEHGLTADLRRIDLVRILIGGIATLRYGEIMQQFLLAGDAEQVLIAGAATCVAACVMVGLLTPVATFALMASGNLLIDNHLGASTLGTMVMSMGMLLLLLAPAGRTLSIDAWLARRSGFGRRIIIELHRVSGPVSADRLLVAKLSSLFAYLCVCLYSVSWHIHDEAWTSGLIVAWVLLSSGANADFYQTAWTIYENFPALYVAFSVVSILGMVFWYVLVLPGLFMGRWVRAFVIYWGLAFFLISTFVLPLRYLGWYELILWFAYFATGPALGNAAGPSVAILFDDRCNLCDRTVKVLSALDLFGRLEFRPIRRNVGFAADHGVTLEEGLTDLVGVDMQTGARVSGFGLYESLSGRVMLLWPFKPVMVLGRLTRIGPAVYRWIADRRTKLFGVCEFSNIPDQLYLAPELHVADAPAPAYRPRLGRLTLSVVATLGVMGAAFLVRLPILTLDVDDYPVASWSKALVGSAPSAFGIHRINVFNEEDLSVFRFKKEAYVEDFDPDPSDTGNPARKVMPFTGSDAQIYHMAAHGRRMSRQNLGCDIDYFLAILPRLRNSYQLRDTQEPASLITFEISISSWPSSKDFWSFRPVEQRVLPLCLAKLNIDEGLILDFYYIQEGVDEALRQKGSPPILAADNVDAVLSYPCRIDGYFLWSLASVRPGLADIPELADALSTQMSDAYGRFPLDCFLDAARITADWPSLTHIDDAVASHDICLTATQLFEQLARVRSNAPHVQETVTRTWERLDDARANEDLMACTLKAITGWKEFLNAMATSKAV